MSTRSGARRHRRRRVRHQLRPAVGRGGVRPPHRPDGPRRQRRQVDQLLRPAARLCQRAAARAEVGRVDGRRAGLPPVGRRRRRLRPQRRRRRQRRLRQPRHSSGPFRFKIGLQCPFAFIRRFCFVSRYFSFFNLI